MKRVILVGPPETAEAIKPLIEWLGCLVVVNPMRSALMPQADLVLVYHRGCYGGGGDWKVLKDRDGDLLGKTLHLPIV